MTAKRRQTITTTRTRARAEDAEVAPTPNDASENLISVPQVNQPASLTRNAKVYTERLGDILRKVRETRGDDIQQIADYLCIRSNFLVALENSRYEEFPADAYVIGFLRSYANYLGVDSREAIDRYRSEMAGRRRKPALMLPTPITEGRTPSAFIMIGAGVAALLIYILWYGLSTSDRTTLSTPPALPSTAAAVPNDASTAATPNIVLATTPDALSSANASSGLTNALPTAPVASLPPSTPTAASSTASTSVKATESPVVTTAATSSSTPAASSTASRLSIRAEQSSWVLITDTKGHTLYDHVLKPGESYKAPNTDGLLLTTGNGSGIVLTLDGVDLPRLSTGSSHVMRNISLDPDHLKSLPPNPEE
jgi:cytoskeleton protein RodZ